MEFDDWLSGLPFIALLLGLAVLLGLRVLRVVGRASTQIDALPPSVQSTVFVATLGALVIVTLTIYVVLAVLLA